MMQLQLGAKFKVVATQAVTWLTFAMAALTIFSGQIASLFPEGVVSENVTTWILRALAWLATAIAIIRQVAPVVPEERGILPQSSPPPEVEITDAPIDEGANPDA